MKKRCKNPFSDLKKKRKLCKGSFCFTLSNLNFKASEYIYLFFFKSVIKNNQFQDVFKQEFFLFCFHQQKCLHFLTSLVIFAHCLGFCGAA